MTEFLLALLIILVVILFGVIIFFWWQFNNTDSRLVKLIERRIHLNNLYIKLDKIQSIDDIKEEVDTSY
ncbi:hypothetical protein KHQ89_07225 [Mycoplasmatota bacterium]|nr:hypothetical protein KHQ89_07225 [Mycoplasmatota bacterium]